MRKPAFCICENKGADRLRGDRAADQGLCFCYIDSTTSPLYLYIDSMSQSNKNIIISSFKSSGDIQKKEGGPDSCSG